MSNSSSITQFLLLAFTDTRELQLLYFCLFLGIYLAALLGNGLIITAIACDHHLHSPMYFFLLNLSFIDLGFVSTTLPKAMANSLWHTRAISYSGCAAQVFFVLFLMSAEFFLLTVMAFDRYIAICKPLHYGTVAGPFSFSAFLFWGCFIFILLSYVQILRAVLRIPSEQGRHKAFSTCLPHLAVVSLFTCTGTFAYLKPPSISSAALDSVMAMLYSVVTPALNPLIYSMRNRDLKDAMKKVRAMFGYCQSSESPPSLHHPLKMMESVITSLEDAVLEDQLD
ncbi:olfactory receptor 14J1-like [Gavia stellata]|uniref:olfactory receptor 14J1-like n=1 Tax=Gavia stellata TaxID=37040 RepID=UPI00289AE699|nr:olfactory receptor 14J1-like [Gavia stellata]